MGSMLSFVIPCYRSMHTISSVLDEIEAKVAERPRYEYEVICVDDCSPDDTLDVLISRAASDRRVKVISLARNGGKHAALLAGFKFANGDFVVALDDDGECPIDRLWDLVDPLLEGWDIAIAHYEERQVSLLKKLFSAVNNEIYHLLFEKPKDITFSNFSARKRFVCEYSTQYEGPFPYLEGITLQVSRNIKSVPMSSRKRMAGHSGFTFLKGLSLTINGCTGYSLKPLRIPFLFSIACFILSIGAWILSGLFEGLCCLLFSLGFFSLGMLGEYTGRIYMRLNNIPQYVVREKFNFDDDSRGQTM